MNLVEFCPAKSLWIKAVGGMDLPVRSANQRNHASIASNILVKLNANNLKRLSIDGMAILHPCHVDKEPGSRAKIEA